jgi:hypothetical protein
MRAKIRPTLIFLIAASAVILAGCWPFHRETDQQKFMEAMNHGNSAQASQIWLNMDAQSRADFAHSQGIQPMLSSEQIKKQVSQHYMDKTGATDSEETIERPTPNVHLGGLESLPEYTAPSGAPPQAVTVPTQNEPAN